MEILLFIIFTMLVVSFVIYSWIIQDDLITTCTRLQARFIFFGDQRATAPLAPVLRVLSGLGASSYTSMTIYKRPAPGNPYRSPGYKIL